MSDVREGEQFEKLKQFLDANKGTGIVVCTHPDNADLAKPLESLEGCTVKLSEFAAKTDDKGEPVIYLVSGRFSPSLELNQPIEIPNLDLAKWRMRALWCDPRNPIRKGNRP